MSKEKQIEEMAADIRLNMQIQPNPKEHPSHQLARLMYADDYRKQSEGEWLSAYDYALKIGETDQDRLTSAEKDKHWKFCSRCDQQIRYLHNYCPNCGAEMRKEDEGK